jgi:multiple sugar transport system permease protein
MIFKNILAIAALLCLCRPAQADAQRQQLVVWAMGAEGKLIRQAAEIFEKRNPGVKIITQAIPWTGAHEKLVTAVVGDMAPDISQMGTTWMPEFRAMNALEPLNAFIASSKLDTGDFFPGARDSNLYQDQWYGLPWYVDTRVMFYRTDLAARAGYRKFPEDWTGFYKFSKAVLRSKNGGYAFALPTNDWQIFLMFYWQNGGELLQSSPLTAGRFEETVGYLKRFFDEKLAPLEGGHDTDLLTAFESGYFPAFISGPWMISQLETSKPELHGLWTTAPLPAGKRHASFMGGCNFVMFKSSTRKALAWKFMQFMAEPQMQAKWYAVSGDLPASRKAWSNPSLSGNPELASFRKELDTAKAPPQVPEWESIAGSISDAVEEAVFGRVTAQTAREKLSVRIKKILAKSERQQSTAFKIALALLLFMVPVCAVVLYLRGARGSMRGKGQPIAIFFLLPAVLILAVFLFIPIVASFIASMTNWNMYGVNDWSKVVFIGLENYAGLFCDPVFLAGLRNTLLFAFIGVPISVALSLAMALALNAQILRAKAFFRVAYFIPVITTMVAVAIIWRWLYNPEFGLFNLALGHLGLPPQSWLSNRWLALPSLIFMAVWKGFGYNTIIFVAALQSIPDSLYESIALDGANSRQEFWYITLPMLRNTAFFVIVMTTIGYLQFFAEPYIMTGGGPLNSTMSVVLYMYQQGFKFYNLGYASAMAYILFGLIFAFTTLQFRVQKKLEGTF